MSEKPLTAGLYQSLIDGTLQQQLEQLPSGLIADYDKLDKAEVADRLVLHISRIIKQTLASLPDNQRLQQGSQLLNTIIDLLVETDKSGVEKNDLLVDDTHYLRALLGHKPDGSVEQIKPPATPLLDTTLLTNAPGEPHIGHQLQTEIASSERIDVLMAFVRLTGIRPLLSELERHCKKGRPLRILTTTYTLSTELAALKKLQAIGADIRVSYDTSTTRLHAKAWLFYRASQYATAYIGSSNLTHSAQVSGLEWNVRLAQARNPDIIEKFAAIFDSYWESGDFLPFDEAQFRQRTQVADKGGVYHISPIELSPRPFQSRLLESIAVARAQGRHRNLLVSATGTGKTVMAAIDYQRQCHQQKRPTLLFVAHRREILEQSLATFRQALRDANFGEYWVGGKRPEDFEQVFASIQSLSANGLKSLACDHFDVVIIDEFHHAAASTYNALLNHLKPKELLGLTATPERADGQSILHWFDHRITAELRIWEAIDQQYLCPFDYYGISDGMDLRHVKWKRGTGYDTQALNDLITGDDVLARRVIAQLGDYVPRLDQMQALGFCVSVEHAHFMAAQFNRHHIEARAVTGNTPTEERNQSLQALRDGKVQILFAVDLFNEGVDIPDVNTLLLLRPTDSATIYLQQLGRGLRKAQGKAVCTVLDFISQHRKEFRFQNRLGALFEGGRQQQIKHIQNGFPYLPSGCHFQLDRTASAIILDNLKKSLPTTWRAKADELRQLARKGTPTLSVFLTASGLTLNDIYYSDHCWSDLLDTAGLPTLSPGPDAKALARGIGRLLHTDDWERIKFYQGLVSQSSVPDLHTLNGREKRITKQLLATLYTDDALKDFGSIAKALQHLWRHPQARKELAELMGVLQQGINHLTPAMEQHPEVPLCIHARYTRREILAAFSRGDTAVIPAWREGVKWLKDWQTDLAVFTLDKSGEHFSPTTRYKDYAINTRLIHWESQSQTRAGSPTGKRYQTHRPDSGSTMLLFARLSPADRAFWFLGPATYVEHEGDRPMAIKWRLQDPLPGDLYARFAAAV